MPNKIKKNHAFKWNLDYSKETALLPYNAQKSKLSSLPNAIAFPKKHPRNPQKRKTYRNSCAAARTSQTGKQRSRRSSSLGEVKPITRGQYRPPRRGRDNSIESFPENKVRETAASSHALFIFPRAWTRAPASNGRAAVAVGFIKIRKTYYMYSIIVLFLAKDRISILCRDGAVN